MKKYLKEIKGAMLTLIVLSASCATWSASILPPLNKRHLRISLNGPYTEYRWYKKCGLFKTCEVIEKDFDFSIPEDRKKFLSMGFDCSVRERP